MIGVVVPAHNEAVSLPACLAALRVAAAAPALGGEPVRIVVVLDACTDASAEAVRAAGMETVAVNARNVGRARAAGAAALLVDGVRWLAFTDADSRVAPDWLVAQLALQADAVCGCVEVDDWSEHPVAVRDRYLARYTDRDGHRHIHGANLGVCAQAYVRAGGFGPHACSEDVALVEALVAQGASIAWSAAPRVLTSARRAARAAGGFSDYLRSLAAPLSPATTMVP